MPRPVVTPNTLTDLLQSINVAIHLDTQFRRFQQLYHNDRIAFVHDCLPEMGKTITFYQEEILGEFDSGRRRIAVRGPHGLGKTFLASILVHHSILTIDDDAKSITTASAWRQLEKYLWPEVRKTAKHLNWSNIGREPYARDEFLSLAIKLNGGTVEAFAIACDDAETIEGAHAKYLTYIFDEAKAIPRSTWNAAEGAFSNANVYKPKGNYEFDDIASDNIGQPIYNNSPRENGIGGMDSADTNKDIFEILDIGEDDRQLYSMDIGSNELELLDKGIPVYKREDNKPIHIEEYKQLPIHAMDNVSDTRKQLDMYSLRNSETIVSSSNVRTNQLSHIPTPQNTLHIRDANGSYRDIPNNISANTYEAIAFAISTPGEPSGQFYDIHMHKAGYEDWYTKHVTIDDAIHAGRISPDWVKQRGIQWGIDSSVYMNRVLGEFADVSDEGIIPLSWIRMAVTRWNNWANSGKQIPDFGLWTIGVDVARGGEDKTVLALRKAWVIQNFHVYSKLSTPQTAGYIERTAYTDSKHIHIEIDGIGAGVYDILKMDGIRNVKPITVSGATGWRDRSKELRFANVRSAMWWNMRELLDPSNSNIVIERYGHEIALPPDDMLILDLCTPKWEMKREATVSLESRDSIVKRLGRSPDHGTAACLAFWNPNTGGGIVF